MTEIDKTKIRDLIDQGYHVEVVNPDGLTFCQRYCVWQNFGWDQLKIVNVKENGQVQGLQG